MLNQIISIILALFGIKSSKKKGTTTSNRTSTTGSSSTSNKRDLSPPPAPEKPKVLEPITFNPPDVTLYLGCYDDNVTEAHIGKYLEAFHINMGGVGKTTKTTKLRHGDLHQWIDPKKVEGTPVMTLQKFLKNAGFIPPYLDLTGIYGYETQAAVRLFQEYIRTIEKDESIGIPDGVIGKGGWKHVKRWAEGRKKASEWQRGKQSAEYKKWLDMLGKAKEFYRDSPHKILDKVNAKVEKLGDVDTLKTSDWVTSENEVHLIGIRRKEEDNRGLRKKRRCVCPPHQRYGLQVLGQHRSEPWS